jgi:hypothetical protein
MNYLKRFLQFKVKTRLFVFIVCVVGVSAIIIAWSTANLLSLTNANNLGDDILGQYISQFLERPKNSNQYPKVAKVVENWKLLSKLVLTKSKSYSLNLKTEIQLKGEQEQYLQKCVSEIDSITWTEIYSYLIKTSNHVTFFDYQNSRSNVNFILNYLLTKKSNNHKFDCKPYLGAVIKMAMFIELNDKVLISQMIALWAKKQAFHTIHTMYMNNQLSADEKLAIVDLMDQSIEAHPTFEQTMWGEFHFMNRAVLRLYKKAPLSCHILELIFGDPIAQYRSLLENGYNTSTESFLKANKHVFLKIMIPNVNKARNIIREFEVLSMCLYKELNGTMGENRFDKARVILVKDPENQNGISSYHATYLSLGEKPTKQTIHLKNVHK